MMFFGSDTRPVAGVTRCVTSASASLLLLAALGGCTSSGKRAEAGSATTTASGAAEASSAMTVDATFQAYRGSGTVAATYVPDQVPVGAAGTITVAETGASTQVTLRVTGLRPGRGYGAHLHKKSCGAKPADAGSHYQDAPDSKTPSTNPRFANASNEVWLDFTTDAAGASESETLVPFHFRAGADGPHSLVIHQTHTLTEAGKAGTAGARLACVNLAG